MASAERSPAMTEQQGYLGMRPGTTNNLAEFTAVHKALEWLRTCPDVMLTQVRLRTDSKLVVNLINDVWNANIEKTRQWRDYARGLISELGGLGVLVKVEWVRGDPDNWVADRLTMIAYAEALGVQLEEAYRLRACEREKAHKKKSGGRRHFKRGRFYRGDYDY